MFDAKTASLIREAPSLRGVDPQTLPQELTSIYAELTALRLRSDQLEAQPERLVVMERVKRLATIYEALVDSGAAGRSRQAAAFVAGTAHQILGRVMGGMYEVGEDWLTASAVHPLVAAPLLFLIAEQNADAREAARPLQRRGSDASVEQILIETIHDLAAERFEAILQRADRLQRLGTSFDGPPEIVVPSALYGLCWAGVVHLVATLLNRTVPRLGFKQFDTPQAAFEEVVRLSSSVIHLPGMRPLTSLYSGPRHLARLLRGVADGLEGSGIVYVQPPQGSSAEFWQNWIRHRARTKPILWRNHREAIATGFLNQQQSAVLVLPTGAGKTTLSELKIAATLARSQKVVFLVPTLALVDQLGDDLATTFPERFADVEVSVDGDLMGLLETPQLQSVEVMTPERCLALLSHAPESLEGVGLVVFDECHLLSPQGGGKRSLDAMLCLQQVLKRAPTADLLLLSAMLSNADEFSSWIAEISDRPCHAIIDSWKPSRRARGVVVYERSRLVEIVRSSRMPGVQPDMGAIPYGLFGLHQNWNANTEVDRRLIKLSDRPVPLALSATTGRPTPNANTVAAQLALQAVQAGLKTIVFVQTASHAPSTAKKIADGLPGLGPLPPAEEALWDDIKVELGGEQYSLATPRSAALPHNGDMIPLERRLVEAIYRRTDGANAVVATPTLAQGMNLPAQLAILAGDKRHEEDGREPLESHEILNAAGRAGRAGHLANGVVILIPEPVAAFQQSRPEAAAIKKLAAVLPPNDQCVRLEDPTTILLDRIQAGNITDSEVRYYISRIRPVEGTDQATDDAIQVVRRSFGGFLSRRANSEAAFNAKLAALQAVLSSSRPLNEEMAGIAASSGFPDAPLVAIEANLVATLGAWPVTIVGWCDWLIDFLNDDRTSYEALLGHDVGLALYVMRGKKTGGPASSEEFARLKSGFRAWLRGAPFCDIERALDVPERRIGKCLRARDLALKLAGRTFYLLIASVAEVARTVSARSPLIAVQHAVFETLPVALRKGLDTPDKVAFAKLNSKTRSRVRIHQRFANEVGQPAALTGQNYDAVKSHLEARIMFSNVRL
ncbi:DEAD/DEAH box helicase [Rhodopseudomonas sp. G2_2311]|uniref:DEAD/DEAH box helicase n=1 Tax=Rhodopseudomonas sp. G2_2311 TaxID=3114287 RepID=UPI0039C651A8